MTTQLRIRIIAFLLLMPFLSFSQEKTDSYTARWKTVDSLIDKKGLPQSALTQVNLIYERARQEKNGPQLLKALIYRIRLENSEQEDAGVKSITKLEKEILTTPQPARSILQNILARLYWNYYQQHRYQLYDRTNTVDFNKDSIATWSADDFHKKIGALYLASLQEEKLLQTTRLETYDPIIIKGNVRALRPTLFDLLAHHALDYFKSDERDLTRPAYAFEIDDPAVFAGAADFTKHSFVTADSISLHYKALLLMQSLLAFHLSDPKPDALLDLDIERLNFAHNYAVMADKDDLYTSALADLTRKWPDGPVAAEAWYLQALQHVNKAARYNPPQDTSGRYEYVTAKAICDKVIAQKDSSEGKVHCAQLLRQIHFRSLEVNVETVNIPGQPFRALVKWRNLSRMYMRIVSFDHATRESLGSNPYQDSYWQKLLQLPVKQTSSQTLPQTGDYQLHRAEVRIDALPVGAYALIVSDDSAFRLGQHVMAMMDLYVSNIGYVNNGRDYFIVDRGSGQPIPRAGVQMWQYTYDYKTNRNVFSRSETYRADEHGHFLMNKPAQKPGVYGQNALEITAGSDHLFLESPYQLFYRDVAGQASQPETRTTYEKENLRTYFFTDRSIYRPGQTLYFKGIVVTRDFDSRKAKILPQFKTKVILYDVNGTRIDSLNVTTNDFGSYHGQFSLPEHLLNGDFRIEDDSTGQGESFNVEEYKRPKFFVSYDTLKGSYRVGDTIRVQGSARAYAGNVIDGAVVQYRVTRQARYPIFCFDCWPRPVSSPQEIAHGTIKTDAKGMFNLSFAAIPDRNLDKNADPTFEYAISADVTDLNGETRSGSTSVRAGYKALELSIQQPSESSLPADSLKTIMVSAANLSGATEPAAVTVTVYSLKAPDRLIRKRSWEAPDQYILSREEYLRLFPHDEYGDETNMAKWEKGDKIWEATDSAGRALTIGKRVSPGWYVIEVQSKDKYGALVKALHYISLYDGQTGKPATPQYSWALEDHQTVEPGEKATVDIGSSAGNVFVIRKVSHDDTTGTFSFLTIDMERKSASFPVTEADRGGFGVEDVFIKDNRVYSQRFTVQVPWTNKELSIHYDTWRDKVLPGSEEKWKVTIKGHQADKVAAEVLAGMYDASLDQFKPHGWSVPDLYPVYSNDNNWEGSPAFGLTKSQQRYIPEKNYPIFDKQYDQLLSIDLHARGRVMLRGVAPAVGAIPQVVTTIKGEEMNLEATRVRKDAIQNDMNPDTRGYFAADKKIEVDTSLILEANPTPESAPVPVQIRKNFNETAFFFPDLKTDDSGSVSFSFTMPEALTQWKWMMLAHTRDLSFGYDEKTVVTQKQLMVQPNAPRFLREGDRMELGVKIVNLTDSEMTGQITMELIDPTTGQTADGIFSNRQANQYFTVAAGQSAVAAFPIDIPYQYNRPLTYKVVARAKGYSDGEEAILPVVSNRMLVTESLPLNMSGDGTKQFHFDKLLQSGSSETLNHHALTVEFTGNPAWYAVQALPYLMEYPYECAEQNFNKFYANALASRIANSSPRIQEIFSKWKTSDTAALLSNLEKNQELKSALLQETPWVLQGKSESQQKKHIALLFDMARMSRELESSLAKLQDMQAPNGGFVWFKGGPDDRYITQYILTGIGHLQKLNAIPPSMTAKVKEIVAAALPYLDGKIKKDYEDIIQRQKNKKPQPLGKPAGPVWIGEAPAQYLYMRSFFNDYGIPGDVFPAVNYFRKQAREAWLQGGKYMQGMIALALFRTGDVQTAKDIIASLKQTAIRDEEKGMYWKGMEGGYYWWQAPIETQSLLIEAFREIAPNAATDNALKTWLLKQKQTHNWTTTKATADACYALLMPAGQQPLSANSWLNTERSVDIQLGNRTFSSSATTAEAGTGYFKQVVDGTRVQPSMGNITVTVKTANTSSSNSTGSYPATSAGATAPSASISPATSPTTSAGPGTSTSSTGATSPTAASSSPAWGAVYWQYFENLDKITAASNAKAPLRLTKKLFIEKNTDRGAVLEPIAENGVLHPGDKVKVRIELQSDRDMEYVHMKDMRASCMEPVNVLSGYKWQGGLGYYESTHDASTDFFFSYLPRGTFVFEYPLFVGQAGNFSNGVTSIECMYAPEFSFHSEGIRVNVEEATP